MSIKIAINGFGRIGRNVFRAILQKKDSSLDLVAINDLTDPKTLALLFKYDSVHGVSDAKVESDDQHLIINGRKIRVFSERNPADLPWGDLGVEVVVESTGFFRKRADAAAHITAGARKVIISAPSPDPDNTIVMGVNEGSYDAATQHIISNASCTTNCLAPVARVLLDNFGITRGLMTTVHAYTSDQRLHDMPHSDMRRARSAALSMIPTSTGAAKAIALVIPELAGKLNGLAVRVPTPNVSLVDLVVELDKPATVAEINAAMKQAAEGNLAGILAYCDEPLVSKDFNGHPASSIFDSGCTYVVGGNMVKVLSWYDNECGYSNRVVDLAEYITKRVG